MKQNKRWQAEMPDVRSSRARPQYDWCPVGQVRLLRDQCNAELDRLHRRLWEKRKECVLAKLDWWINTWQEALDMALVPELKTRQKERLGVAWKRYNRVQWMEYKP